MPTKPIEKVPENNEDNKEISLDPTKKIFNGSIWEPNGKSRRWLWRATSGGN